MIPDESVEAMSRVARDMGPEFFRAWRRAMSGDERAMVELVVLTLDDYRAAEYLALPAHLPDGEHEQRLLLASGATADHEMRESLRSWARENRDRGDHASKALENLSRAYWSATTMYEGSVDGREKPDAEAANWAGRLRSHVRRCWGRDVAEAPRAPVDLVRWSASVAMGANPSPAWMLFGGDMPRAYQSDPKRTRRAERMTFERGRSSDDE